MEAEVCSNSCNSIVTVAITIVAVAASVVQLLFNIAMKHMVMQKH